jgi:hypothetical protein
MKLSRPSQEEETLLLEVSFRFLEIKIEANKQVVYQQLLDLSEPEVKSLLR